MLANQFLDGKIPSDAGLPVKPGEFFSVSSDLLLNYFILTGLNEHWPDRFITYMERKLKTHVTTVFSWNGERDENSLTDISDDKMEQVDERIKQYG